MNWGLQNSKRGAVPEPKGGDSTMTSGLCNFMVGVVALFYSSQVTAVSVTSTGHHGPLVSNSPHLGLIINVVIV